MLKRLIGIGLLGFCLVMVAVVIFTSAGCLDTQAKEQIKKDALQIAALAIQYKTCEDVTEKAELQDQLKEKAQELAKRYGQAAAVLVIKRLEAKGKLKPDIANWLLEKLNAADKEEEEADAVSEVKKVE